MHISVNRRDKDKQDFIGSDKIPILLTFVVMDRVFRWVIEHSTWLFALLFSLTLGGAWLLWKNFGTDNSIQIWFLKDDPHIVEYLQFQREYGSDEIAIALLRSDSGVWHRSFIERLGHVHRALDTLPYVDQSYSLYKVREPRLLLRRVYFRPLIGDTIDEGVLKRKIGEIPGIRGLLVDSAANYAVIYVRMKPTEQLGPLRKRILRDLHTIVGSYFKDYHFAGFPIVNEAVNKALLREALFFSIVSLLLIVAILLVFLPELRFLWIAVLSVFIPVLLTYGLYFLMGHQLNSMTIIIPTVIMVYALADEIHILNSYFLTDGRSVEERLLKAFRISFRPCFYTTLTTTIGYVTLTLALMPALRMFGLYSAIGMFIAFVSTYIITSFGILRHKKLYSNANPLYIDPKFLVERLVRWTDRYARPILYIFIAVSVLGFAALFRLRVDSDSRNLLPRNVYKQSLIHIDTIMGGNIVFFIQVDSDTGHVLSGKRKEVLRRFVRGLRRDSEIHGTVSIVDVIDYILRSQPTTVLQGVNQWRSARWDGMRWGNQADDAAFPLIDSTGRRAMIVSRVPVMRASRYRELHHRLDSMSRASGLQDEGLQMRVKGFSPLYIKMVEYIYLSQVRSFFTALVVVFGILIYYIRDWRLSLLAMVPNLTPILMMFVLMWVVGIDFEAGTSIVAPIMLGIVMDDTIHLLHHYKRYRMQGWSVQEAINGSLRYAGRAVVTTSVALGLGFLIIAFSAIPTLSHFGLLSSATVFFALLADAIFLPALIKLYGRNSRA